MFVLRTIPARSLTAVVVLAGIVAAEHAHARGDGPMRGLGPGPGPHAEALLEEFDSDGDGAPTQAEVDAVQSKRIGAFGSNGDGVLSLKEFEALWLVISRPHMVRRFQAIDRDASGGASHNEFPSPTSALIEYFDQDGDGKASRRELLRSPPHMPARQRR